MITSINFFAQYYYDLIDDDDAWLEPGLAMHIVDEDLLFQPNPCHNHAFELSISLISETSVILASTKERDSNESEYTKIQN